ncbi:MAG: ATP-binding cassette domain-containing protein [Actinomycetes bacterium]
MINVKNLSFYRESRVVIDELDLQLEKGELVLLSGSNGVGKSTLLQLIGGVLKPTSGEITINGTDISEMKVKDQALLRSIAPQRRIFSLAYSVGEVLHLLPEKRRSFNVDLIIESLGLVEIMASKVTELSIGQQQRVSLAIALIQEADFYLLDEPFSAQDEDSVLNLVALLAEIKKEKGVMVVSHNTGTHYSQFDREIKLT